MQVAVLTYVTINWRQKPNPLVKNNNSKGVSRETENSDSKTKAMKRIGNLYHKI